MTVKSYGDSDVLVLAFHCNSFDDSTEPAYATGNASVSWKPRSDMPCEVIGVDGVGVLSAAGTAATLIARVYKGTTLSGPNIAMAATTEAMDDAGDISCSSTSPANSSTGKQFITSADGIVVTVSQNSATTYTCTNFVVYVTLRFR